MDNQFSRSLLLGLGAAATGGSATAAGAALGLTSFDAVWPVATSCAIAGALIHGAKQSIAGLVDNRTHTLRSKIEHIHRNIGDIHGLVRLAPYTDELPLPLGGGWALTGDSAALLARETLVRKPERVLELGSGASSLLIGQILKKHGGGRLLSVDHDPGWAQQTRRYVDVLGLGDTVTVLDAPLRPLTISDREYRWYDLPAERLDSFGAIDLLVVDGPPQPRNSGDGARYPAFPLLRGRLSPDALVFVDDAGRQAESRMIETWLKEAPDWTGTHVDTVDGVCLLTRQAKAT